MLKTLQIWRVKLITPYTDKFELIYLFIFIVLAGASAEQGEYRCEYGETVCHFGEPAEYILGRYFLVNHLTVITTAVDSQASPLHTVKTTTYSPFFWKV